MSAAIAPGEARVGWRRFDAAWVVFFLICPQLVTALILDLTRWMRWSFAPLNSGVASFLVYGVFGCGLGVIGVWLWARPRGLVRDIFMFRRPRAFDWPIAVIAFVIGIAIYLPSQWIARVLLGASVRGMNFDFHSPYAIPVMVVATVIVGTFGEEVLYRGLGVAYLRTLRWPSWAVWLTMVVAFTLYHVPYFGVAGAAFIFFWAAIVTAIRLWRDSLTPGWIVHILNNGCAYVLFPLLLSHR